MLPLKKRVAMRNLIILVFFIILLIYFSFKNYLFVHSLIELFSIVISFNIFIMALNIPHIFKNNYFIFIGLAYGFVGSFDLLHTLAYKGMGIFSGFGANLPTQLWIISRYLEAGSLLVACIYFAKQLKEYKINKNRMLIIYTIISFFLLLSVFYWRVFPDCFIEGEGLTFFKIVSEYIISGIILLVVILLYYNRSRLNNRTYRFMSWALISTVLAELAFTRYVNVYGLSNLLGHIFKLISFYLIYKAVSETNLKKSYELLFYKLYRNNLGLTQRNIKLQKYLDIAAVILLVLNKEGRVVWINQKGCEIVGYDEIDIVGKDWFDNFIKAEDRRAAKDIFNQVINKKLGTVQHFESNIMTSEGRVRTIAWYKTLLKDEADEVKRVLSTGMDITEQKQAEDEMKYISYHDSLTGLYNRNFYEKKLEELDRDRSLPLSIIIGDVNGLKLTNDIFGHEIGDKLLQEIADIISSTVREEDIVARWGGDEFSIILPETNNCEAEKIISRINKKCKASNFKPLPPSIALGSATKVIVGQQLKEIFNTAEEKMYQAKSESKEGLESSFLLQAITDRLENSNYAVVGHTRKIISLAEKMGEALNLSKHQKDNLPLLARFHDIGKLNISDEILKKGELLDQEEWEEYQQHSKVGYDIAKNFRSLSGVANSILHHHEFWNGNGYPQGLKEEEIPLLARIIHIIDAYDAMTYGSFYPMDETEYYYGPLTKRQALTEIQNCSGRLFDPELVKVFVDLVSDEIKLQK